LLEDSHRHVAPGGPDGGDRFRPQIPSSKIHGVRFSIAARHGSDRTEELRRRADNHVERAQPERTPHGVGMEGDEVSVRFSTAAVRRQAGPDTMPTMPSRSSR